MPDPTKLLPFFWQFSRDDEESYPYEYTRFEKVLDEDAADSARRPGDPARF